MLKILISFVVLIFSLEANSPNVLIFLTDDQGWGDLSLHGNKNLDTPHIDNLAKSGVQFENFYVSQLCAPTRAEFLTGRYHMRTGVSGVTRGQERINVQETTLAQVFKQRGYKTGCFGKWHNGTQAPYHPMDKGFDEFYGFTSGHWGHYFSPPLDHNRQQVKGEGFIVDDITNKAIDFIERHQKESFLCYIPFNTPHSPMYVKDSDYEKFKNLEPDMKYGDSSKEDVMMTRAALALMENIDDNVGRVIKTLEKLKLDKDTIVIFFSDNGPNSYRWNGGMKGKKGMIEEGGLRSPLFISWPSQLKAGKMVSEVVGAIDLFPSILDLCDFRYTSNLPLDGLSFSSLIRGNQDSWNRERVLFSIKKNSVSVRSNSFRLDSEGSLFDIKNDRSQSVDVSNQYPEVHQKLMESASRFKSEMLPYQKQNKERPYTVGYAKRTMLPARDGNSFGGIKRSSKSANNSFFTNWTKKQDKISWQVELDEPGLYQAIVYYTLPKEGKGFGLKLEQAGAASIKTMISKEFNPPLYDKSKERVEKSHYFMKDFKPHVIGEIQLLKGESELLLLSTHLENEIGIDVIGLELVKK